MKFALGDNFAGGTWRVQCLWFIEPPFPPTPSGQWVEVMATGKEVMARGKGVMGRGKGGDCKRERVDGHSNKPKAILQSTWKFLWRHRLISRSAYSLIVCSVCSLCN
jgi:hypothetical protein